MTVFLAVVFTFVAGIINGSFAIPTHYIKQWNFENIWLFFSLWCFLILPWATLLLIDHHAWEFYSHIPADKLMIIIGGGILFGIGQVCFVQALKMIGLGLGFVINIGLGTGLGFLLPLVILHPEKIVTPFGLVTFIGLFLIIGGLLLSYSAGKQRDAHQRTIKKTDVSPQQYPMGVLLAVIAGIGSAGQNFTFAATHQLQQDAWRTGVNALASSIIIWPLFLNIAFVVFALYMVYLHHKNKTYINYQSGQNSLNILLTFCMGFPWFASLIFYSVASLMIGSLGPIIAWPLFMVLIILTSNFWGWRHREWMHTTPSIVYRALKAIGLMVLAVIVLGFSATLST